MVVDIEDNKAVFFVIIQSEESYIIYSQRVRGEEGTQPESAPKLGVNRPTEQH